MTPTKPNRRCTVCTPCPASSRDGCSTASRTSGCSRSPASGPAASCGGGWSRGTSRRHAHGAHAAGDSSTGGPRRAGVGADRLLQRRGHRHRHHPAGARHPPAGAPRGPRRRAAAGAAGPVAALRQLPAELPGGRHLLVGAPPPVPRGAALRRDAPLAEHPVPGVHRLHPVRLGGARRARRPAERGRVLRAGDRGDRPGGGGGHNKPGAIAWAVRGALRSSPAQCAVGPELWHLWVSLAAEQ
jgi:hypothetical protein